MRTDDMPAEPFIPGVTRHAPPRRWSCCQHKAVSDASVLAAASGPRLMREPGFHGAYRQILLCVRLTSYAFPAKDMHDTFHGFPAQYMGNQASWIFDTGNAHFQVDVTIPGVEEPVNPGGPIILTTATPLPATWVATDQVDVGEILASFQPTDLKALSC
jgi:hypothetical protein